MHCPQCQHDNRNTARFCAACGSAFPLNNSADSWLADHSRTLHNNTKNATYPQPVAAR